MIKIYFFHISYKNIILTSYGSLRVFVYHINYVNYYFSEFNHFNSLRINLCINYDMY